MMATVEQLIKWLNHMPPEATVSVASGGKIYPIGLVSGDLPHNGRFQRAVLHADDTKTIVGSRLGQPI